MAPIPRDDESTARSRDAGSFEPYSALPAGPGEPWTQALEHLRLQPVSAVEWHCTKDWALGPRQVQDAMWFWIEAGAGWGQIAGAPRFRLEPGRLMLIPQAAEHSVRQDPGSRGMHVLTCHFYAHVFGGLDLLALAGFPHCTAHPPGSPVPAACHALVREFGLKAPGWRAAMLAEIQRVLFVLLRTCGEAFEPHDAAGSPRLWPALQQLDLRWADPDLRVADLARTVHLSEVQFRKLFRKVTGLSPVRFLQRRRIERAGHLLRAGELSIEQIARACGFRDAPFFCRVFRAWTQTTPGRFRHLKSV
ncbi:MAG: hypothetical protein AMXMBFR7_30280 [Planctomycetota bacterium]